MKITVIIPVFNELKTVRAIIDKILNLKDLDIQIILVDDFSTDGTRELIENELSKKVDKVLFHSSNKGKGSAIISAKKFIKGNIVIIQDGDLEYDPKDYYQLIKPILDNSYKIVYGSRVLGKGRYRTNKFTSLFRIFCNHILTIISNFINSQNLTDAHTCYKVFKSEVFNNIILEENGFNFCPEITTKVSNLGIKIFEVPISYNGRTHKEGKKIKLIDGFEAILTIIKYKFFIRK
ncbi:glycosyltransferase family 2 protein [Pelagibacterales bacterium SAG-MED08]|nr:glycosyltransferase family 2 protein [Pelagibacterales bacterium SAG-MED08]|tara:strand:- start:753 stop:1457 length:705 start_codon:yes stop_codon:yes gene_type:complete